MEKRVYKGDPTELAIPNWDLVSGAIKAGKTDEALDCLEYTRVESRKTHDGFCSAIEMHLTRLANFDEQEVYNFLRFKYSPTVVKFLSTNPDIVETLQQCTASQRRHDANFTITEESDRYVARYDPCGSGGRLRRTRSVGVTKKAYPWSWGKVGVPYYCCHCAMHWEILPAELTGYPAKIVLVGDRPEDPCIHLFYKKPELIPEEYFTRIGMKKDLSSERKFSGIK